MTDEIFLQHALEKAFKHPFFQTENSLSADIDNKTSDIKIIDTKNKTLLSQTIPFLQIDKCLRKIKATVSPRRNPRLYKEYGLYKHYKAENIIIPDTVKNIRAIQNELNLTSVDRQSAQKKKVVATIFPPNFSYRLCEIKQQYTEDINRVQTLLNQNPREVYLSCLNDFTMAYKKSLKQLNFPHLFRGINRKRLLYYLNEAAQLQKGKQKIADDFCHTHTFLGENFFFTRKIACQYRKNLEKLLDLMQKISKEPILYGVIQALLVSTQKYSEAVKKYRIEYNIGSIEAINTIRHNLQDLFNNFAYLNYLDGVRMAFENRFLCECPAPQNPPLPTVSPLDEIVKIQKIIKESRKINSNANPIGQLYIDALKNYESSHNILIQSLIK